MAAASITFLGCPAQLDDRCAERACDPTARLDGGAGDPCVDRPSDPACLDDTSALFVSNAGDDGAGGTRAAPLKTLNVALGKLSGAKKRIYVCEGTYDANVEIKTDVAIFGGFSCAWELTSAKVKIAPPKGIALRVTAVSGPVVVQDVEVVGSADSSVPGDSAIAAFVSESSNVTLRRVVLRAGAGTAGAKGAARSNYTGPTATAGGNANGSTAGVGPTCACVDGSSSKGGNGAAGSGAGTSDGNAVPAAGVSNGGLSGPATCTDGQVGANGAASAAGAAAASVGVLSAGGWGPPPSPSPAPNGNPAQGGGGGGAKTNSNNGGGGGACGGCGGAGAEPGTGGGSSFALLAFQSSIVIEGGELATGAGGSGGVGGDGQPGQAGGPIGTGACNGGAGGSGAGGSGGGGGAGGHSVPIAFVGKEPKVTGATLTPSAKGAGGAGGIGGPSPGNSGANGALGAEGKAERTLAL